MRTGSFRPSGWPPPRECSVSVCLPARNEARTIGPILSSNLMPLRERGVLDQIVVVDRSSDGTAEIARAIGAEVHDQDELMPELGPVLGKGDAMWRALPVLSGRGDLLPGRRLRAVRGPFRVRRARTAALPSRRSRS